MNALFDRGQPFRDSSPQGATGAKESEQSRESIQGNLIDAEFETWFSTQIPLPITWASCMIQLRKGSYQHQTQHTSCWITQTYNEALQPLSLYYLYVYTCMFEPIREVAGYLNTGTQDHVRVCSEMWTSSDLLHDERVQTGATRRIPTNREWCT